MSLQKQVNLYVPEGVAGDPAVPDQMIYQTLNYIAEEPVAVGSFVFAGTDPSRQAKQGGRVLLGFVQRNLSYFNYDVTSAGTLMTQEGANLMVAVRGDFFAVTKTNATVGQKVFADTTTGEIKTGAAGANVTGCIETNWYVKTDGNAGDTIIISAWA